MKDSRGTLSLSAKSVHTQESLTQKGIARWDNEGGAGPDGPQESHSRPQENRTLKPATAQNYTPSAAHSQPTEALIAMRTVDKK